MSLRPLLFVGIGGTGGKVLGAARHYLLRQLRDKGVDDLPAAWQMIHIDVPSVRDSDEEGMPFSLPEDQYYALTQDDHEYPVLHESIRTRALNEPEGRRFSAWDSWAPAPPAAVPGNVSDGAGQLRGIGRVALLSQLNGLAHSLGSASLQPRGHSNLQDLDELCEPLDLALGQREGPEVFVVGSLSGGSGSGMVVDVCDILRAQGYRPILLAFTPEVFVGTPAEHDGGLAPNTFLALSELLNAAWRTQPDDMPVSRSLHYRAAQVANPRTAGGPAALALVGRSNRHHQLGDGPQVFRTTGRMLASLATDPSLLTSLINFVLTNADGARATSDRLGLRVPDANDGSPVTRGLGFATISVGREFFADYARFRLLRHCAERLLEAHLLDTDANTSKTADQLKQDAVENSFATFLRELQLNESGYDAMTGMPHDDVLNAVSTRNTDAGNARIADFSRSVQQAIIDLSKPGLFGRSIPTRDATRVAAQWVKDATEPGERGMLRPAVAQSHALIEEYRPVLSQRLAEMIPASVADRGLPVTIELLARTRAQLRTATAELTTSADEILTSARSLTSDLNAGLGINKESFRDNDHDRIALIVATAADALASHILASEHRLAAVLCEQIRTGLLGPWQKALESALTELALEVRPQSAPEKQPINHWPRRTGIPNHFRPSKVEFLLDDIEQFPQDFERVVSRRFPDVDESDPNIGLIRQHSVNEAVRMILMGEELTPTGTIQVSSYEREWVPDLGDTYAPQAAAVSTQFRQAQLMSRIQQWLHYPQSSTLRYLTTTMGDYLTAADDPTNTALAQTRQKSLVTQFDSWLRAAEPLVAIDGGLLASVHGATTLAVTPILSTLNVPSTLPELRQQLTGRFNAVFPSQAAPEFDDVPAPGASAFTFSTSFHPVVCASVMGPMAKGDTFNWEYRRTRPLPELVPLTPSARRRITLGWYAGRLLGKAELSGSDDSTRVRVRTDDVWNTVNLKGLRAPRPAVEYDVPGRILESVLLAMLDVYRQGSLAPLQPVNALLELGTACAQPGGPISRWVRHGVALDPSEDVRRLSAAATAAERSELVSQAVAAFKEGIEYMVGQAKQEKPPASWGWVTREILDDVEWAIGTIQDSARVLPVPPQA